MPTAKRQTPGSHSAFTLIEVTVVTAIIITLGAILFPVFTQARAKGREIVCQENLQQIGVALQLYARDHDGFLPPRHNDFAPLANGYLRGHEVLTCGDDPLKGREVRTLPDGRLVSSYQYRGGLQIEDRPDVPLCADWELRHNRGGNTLHLSGWVKWRNLGDWTPVGYGPRPGTSAGAQSPGLTPTPFLNSPTKITVPPDAAVPGGFE